MANFANIDSENKVTQVIVVDSDAIATDPNYLTSTLHLTGSWVQTSYNTIGGIHRKGGTPLRKNYARIGFTYDSERDAFIPPKPFESWTLNEDTCQWQAPVPYPVTALSVAVSGSLDTPVSAKKYKWNETARDWEEYTPVI